MSIELMSRVWKSGRYNGANLLMLLALADMANDEGICWPSYNTLAQRCRVHRTTAVRIIQQLMSDGVLTIVEHGGNATGNNRANVYALNARAIESGVVAPRYHRSSATPPPVVAQRNQGSSADATRVVARTLPQSSIEPSLNQHDDEMRRRWESYLQTIAPSDPLHGSALARNGDGWSIILTRDNASRAGWLAGRTAIRRAIGRTLGVEADAIEFSGQEEL